MKSPGAGHQKGTEHPETGFDSMAGYAMGQPVSFPYRVNTTQPQWTGDGKPGDT